MCLVQNYPKSNEMHDAFGTIQMKCVVYSGDRVFSQVTKTFNRGILPWNASMSQILVTSRNPGIMTSYESKLASHFEI